MSKFRSQLILYSVIFFGTIFIIEWNFEGISKAYKVFLPKEHKQQERIDLPLTAEEDYAQVAKKLEEFYLSKKYEKIMQLTKGRKEIVSLSYRALAIMESDISYGTLLEAIQIMQRVITDPNLPRQMATRLAKSLGDPENTGVSAEENLKAYQEIVSELDIASKPFAITIRKNLEKQVAETNTDSEK